MLDDLIRDSRLIRERELCRRFGVSRATVRHAVKSRRLRFYRWRWAIYFSILDVERFMRRRRQEQAAEAPLFAGVFE